MLKLIGLSLILAASGAVGAGLAGTVKRQQAQTLALIDALLLIALGKHGLGDDDGAKKALDELVGLEPENMKLCFLRMVGIL